MGTIKATNIEPIADNGTVTLGSSGDTLTVPSGVTVAGAMANTPAFRAYQNSAQSLGNTTQTVISYGVESYDTDNCYSTSTYRFTPNKAGKYLIGMSIRFDNVNSARTIGYIYKNSSPVAISEEWSDSGGGPDNHPQCTTIVEMNGSTDYVEARAYHDKGFAVNSGIVGEVTYFFGQRLIGV